MLDFEVVVKCKETETDIVTVTCSASFTFNDINSIDDIPNYFYPNSIAIIFPYIRAFVSTISLQANVQPVILPTINLMGLTEVLKNKTQVIS
jgi:preprotein translocase subunit SecB